MRPAAFSLIEILISLGVISVLAALVFGAGQKAQNTGLRADALAKMRQVGMAIQMFANDHDNTLPGPLWGGQSPWYKADDTRTLGYQLWSYLDAPEPNYGSQEVAALAPKAYVKARPNKDAMSFLINSEKLINDQSPWGYQAASEPVPSALPMKISLLTSVGLAKTWAMQDVDKTHKSITPSHGWYPKLPSQPIYKPHRLCLYFDWHVAAEPIK